MLLAALAAFWSLTDPTKPVQIGDKEMTQVVIAVPITVVEATTDSVTMRVAVEGQLVDPKRKTDYCFGIILACVSVQ